MKRRGRQSLTRSPKKITRPRCSKTSHKNGFLGSLNIGGTNSVSFDRNFDLSIGAKIALLKLVVALNAVDLGVVDDLVVLVFLVVVVFDFVVVALLAMVVGVGVFFGDIVVEAVEFNV